MTATFSIRRSLKRISEWLSRRLSSGDKAAANGAAAKKHGLRQVVFCLLIFFMALGVRLFHWQDDPATLNASLSSLVNRYQTQAEGILENEGILFPAIESPEMGIQRLVHPPGYPIFIAAVYKIFGHSKSKLIWAQLFCNALAVVMLFLIVSELLPRAVASVAAILASLSPHLSAYSAVLLPDSLVALPVLTAVYLLLRVRSRPRLFQIIVAGALIGFSCWLRSNAMLLAPFLAAMVFLTFDKTKRWRYALIFVVAALAAIAPVTIRNWVLYDRFIPLSLGAGITLVEGIGDYDGEKRFAMPTSDAEAKSKDAEWHNRPDYENAVWRPDGIERDRYRFSRGLAVIRANPFWFLSVMARRAASMLRYNDKLQQGWPADSSKTSLVSATVPFGHEAQLTDEKLPAWSETAKELLANGQILANDAQASLSADEQVLQITSDANLFGQQFSSATIPINKNSDYLLKIEARLKQAPVALLVTSADRKITLGSLLMSQVEESVERREAKKKPDEAEKTTEKTDATNIHQPEALKAIPDGFNTADKHQYIAEIAFASGNQSAARLLVINNGGAPAAIELGKIEVFAVGKTPFLWTQPFRFLVRLLQKVIFRTEAMMLLILTGGILLALARKRRVLILLLAIPLYYLCVQSVFHTEYRYILPMHYFLFALAATTFAVAGASFKAGALKLAKRKHPKTNEADDSALSGPEEIQSAVEDGTCS